MTLETVTESATATLGSKVPALDVDTPFHVPCQLVASLLAPPHLGDKSSKSLFSKPPLTEFSTLSLSARE